MLKRLQSWIKGAKQGLTLPISQYACATHNTAVSAAEVPKHTIDKHKPGRRCSICSKPQIVCICGQMIPSLLNFVLSTPCNHVRMQVRTVSKASHAIV